MHYATSEYLIALAMEGLSSVGISWTQADVKEIAFPKSGNGPEYELTLRLRPPYQITSPSDPDNKRSRRRMIDREKLLKAIQERVTPASP